MLPTSIIEYLQFGTPFIALVALVLAIVSMIHAAQLRKRLTKLMLGRNGSIEESLSILGRDVKEIQAFRIELEKYLKHIELRVRSSVRGIGMLRFNPFSGDGSGGNQSFAVAFLDEGLSGVVFSTLYAHDHIGVYAKPIDKGTSIFALTIEEKCVIEKAKQSLVQPTQTITEKKEPRPLPIL